MEAGHFHLDNIIAVIDCNRLQIDGWVKDVMQVEPLADKYAAFGWEVMRIDGHDMSADCRCLRAGPSGDRQAGRDSRRHREGQGRQLHGEPARLARQGAESRRTGRRRSRNSGLAERIPVEELLAKAKSWQAEARRASSKPRCRASRATIGGTPATPCRSRWSPRARASAVRWPNTAATSAWSASGSTSPAPSPSAISMPASRSAPGAGSAWASRSSRPRRPRRDWRAKASCPCSAPTPRFPRRATSTRFASRSATPTSTCWLPARTRGVSVGPDGATHQALEDLFAMQGLPNMSVVVPCDAIETRKATRLPAAQACGAQVHSLCPRGHAHRHQRVHAFCLRQGQRDSPARRKGRLCRRIRDAPGGGVQE